MFAFSSRTFVDAITPHPQRIGILKRLSGRIQTVSHVRVCGVHAVKRRPRAHATGDSFVVRKFCARARIDTANRQVVHRALTRRRNALGNRLRQGLEDCIDNTLRGLYVSTGD